MRRAPISRYVMKKDPFGVFSLSVYWRSDLVQVPRYSRLPENLIITKQQSFLSQIFAEIQTFIYLLGDRLCPVGHKNPPQQLMVHFPPPDHPRRIQLQQCLEISKITVYLRKNNQGLSAAHLQQESRPVMKSLISPSLLYLLRYISHYILHFSPFVFSSCSVFMGGFFQ